MMFIVYMYYILGRLHYIYYILIHIYVGMLYKKFQDPWEIKLMFMFLEIKFSTAMDNYIRCLY